MLELLPPGVRAPTPPLKHWFWSLQGQRWQIMVVVCFLFICFVLTAFRVGGFIGGALLMAVGSRWIACKARQLE